MAGALRAIFFGFALLYLMLTMFSIVTVNLIHPLNKELAKSGAYDDRDPCDPESAVLLIRMKVVSSTMRCLCK